MRGGGPEHERRTHAGDGQLWVLELHRVEHALDRRLLPRVVEQGRAVGRVVLGGDRAARRGAVRTERTQVDQLGHARCERGVDEPARADDVGREHRLAPVRRLDRPREMDDRVGTVEPRRVERVVGEIGGAPFHVGEALPPGARRTMPADAGDRPSGPEQCRHQARTEVATRTGHDDPAAACPCGGVSRHGVDRHGIVRRWTVGAVRRRHRAHLPVTRPFEARTTRGTNPSSPEAHGPAVKPGRRPPSGASEKESP